MHETLIEPPQIGGVSVNNILPTITPQINDVLVLNTRQFGQRNESIINLINERINDSRLFYSIEVSARSETTLNFDQLSIFPLFAAVTWFANVNLLKNNKNERASPVIRLAEKLPVPTLQHISCYEMTTPDLIELLHEDYKIRNIFSLRGDFLNPDQQLLHAIDLVKEIRNQTKDRSITIGVAGYPEVHPEATSAADDLRYLKEKVDAGADFIIAQLCYSSEKFIKFVRDCREIGIKVPIIPGMYIPDSYKGMKSMCKICASSLPENTDVKKLFELRKNSEDFENYSLDMVYKLITEILNNQYEKIPGIHFFTLNKFKLVEKLLKRINFE